MVAEPGGLRAVVSSGGEIIALMGDDVLGFVPVAREACLSDTDLWCSAVESLRAWGAVGLDLRILRRQGLPVWCARHRAQRSVEPCGRLDVRQPG
ncbi:hypothetical protein IOD16_03215 [Saccharothrix sp. 6-C]|uniref:hypothetical protein n=1 Tax=Saccharothrix sp. 6-C TaxID=2781735 RepID=UPI001916FA62|nr:hypothetical protein [Saccharothrix sp. 6-C]QQQ77549.1 hypothetical protein IOD16_03215 [Saccharothrix sp. 6-C]